MKDRMNRITKENNNENKKDIITLAHGSGGKEMIDLINNLRIYFRGEWSESDNDSSVLDIGDGKLLVFTTDSFVVDPLFFPGGDIGHIAFCGTVNDLAVMGAKPIGLSLSLVIEEGFSQNELRRILDSINSLSNQTKIPIVTGDTKVMDKNKVDKIIINTSGVGIASKNELLTKKIRAGDKVILSGGIGEHAVALLSKRFDYETSIITDSKPLVEELSAVRCLIKIAKDPTRGGISAVLNEIAERNNAGIMINEENIPMKKEVEKVTEMLGIDPYELASEGRFVCVSAPENAKKVESLLKRFNKQAAIIGEVIEINDNNGSGNNNDSGNIKNESKHIKKNCVIIKTFLGKRILHTPSGIIVPRIC